MKGVEDKIVQLNTGAGPFAAFGTSVASHEVYLAHHLSNSGEEHDGRGLVVAVLLCIACWGALGFFLLS